MKQVAKRCCQCKKIKPLEDFHKDKSRSDGYASPCKACVKIRTREYHKKHRVERNARQREYNRTHKKEISDYNKQYRKDNPLIDKKRQLLKNYGITYAQYIKLSESQGNVCAICGGQKLTLGGQRTHKRKMMFLYVDHDHKTGKVRALLCNSCNWLLGHANDDPTTLRRAAKYLEKHNG